MGLIKNGIIFIILYAITSNALPLAPSEQVDSGVLMDPTEVTENISNPKADLPLDAKDNDDGSDVDVRLTTKYFAQRQTTTTATVAARTDANGTTQDYRTDRKEAVKDKALTTQTAATATKTTDSTPGITGKEFKDTLVLSLLPPVSRERRQIIYLRTKRKQHQKKKLSTLHLIYGK